MTKRNNPHITAIDTLASLSVGNGGFAVTVDATGMQTWPELYSGGVPLGTMSWWGWHSFPNPEGYAATECLEPFDFGRASAEELYSCQFPDGRRKAAADYLRANPHRLHLGCTGFKGIGPEEVGGVSQSLELWRGAVRSSFEVRGRKTSVETFADPGADAVCYMIDSPERIPVELRFAYPTGGHSDDACDWTVPELHNTEILSSEGGFTLLRRTLDAAVYYVSVRTEGACAPVLTAPNVVEITPVARRWSLTVLYSPEIPRTRIPSSRRTRAACARHWRGFWKSGGFVDFGRCTDPRAPELERRVVLSQYLTAIQCSAPVPPQETGLVYNSWFGKFHLEMTWWHQAHFALWGRPQMLERTMPWFASVAPEARQIAARQGLDGVRWMKMTDPSGAEAPSDIGSFLIWQQPHYIHYAELLRRAGCDVEAYAPLVQATAEFMASFVTRDEDGRYVLKGCIPAQETLPAERTVNPPFELAYWRWGLSVAQQWRERGGSGRDAHWDEIIDGLAAPASRDGLYLAAESEPDTYSTPALYSDHMAVLGALGFLPASPLIDTAVMRSTLGWVMENWNWESTWGWDFPLTCMDAVRLGEPETALEALLMPAPKNTYLPDGHNWQSGRLRCYLPGNGGLLAAVAMMCAGYDGCTEKNPGFPRDGLWDVRWEGLSPMP